MKTVYEEVKGVVDGFISEQKNCCAVGCAFCCYQTIEVLSAEIEPIKDFLTNRIPEETKDRIRKNLDEYFVFFDKNTPDGKTLDKNDLIGNFQEIFKSSKAKAKCPMLIENKCSIYEGRPLACRLHIVEEKPEECEANAYRDSSPPAANARQKMLAYVASKQPTYIVPLPYIAAETLLPEKKLKAIKKMYVNKS